MLPCLVCAAFNTWVIPNFCKAALFWATALARQRDRKRFKTCVTAKHHFITFTCKAKSLNMKQNIYLHIPYVYFWPDLINFIKVQFAWVQNFLQVLHSQIFLSLIFQGWHSQSKSPCLGSIIGPNVCRIKAVPVSSGSVWSVRAGVCLLSLDRYPI